MNTVELSRQIKQICAGAFADTRVTPSLPRDRPRRAPSDSEAAPAAVKRRDGSSSWSLYIEYTDSAGYISDRRITLIRAESRLSGYPALSAFCHEAGEYRVFRLDRISAMACCETGELFDPGSHIAELRAQGLPFRDLGLATYAKLLVFIARCDGNHHPAEWLAIDDALARYALHFGGMDDDYQAECKAARFLAPDATDFANALIAVSRSPAERRRSLTRLLSRASGEIIDADGVHAFEEIQWGTALDRIFTLIGR